VRDDEGRMVTVREPVPEPPEELTRLIEEGE